jgi:multidrug resistance efflux pump
MDARRQLHVEEERGRLLRMKLEKVESATEGMQLKPDDKRFVQVLALFGGDQIMQASLDAEKKQAEVQRLKNLVAKRREELEDCALQVARARDRVAQVEAPYRSEIARLAEEEKALMARIMSDPTEIGRASCRERVY